MSNKQFVLALAATALSTFAGTAAAHHSYAPYDMTKTVKAAATIKEFYWGAPHSSASFVIRGEDGQPQNLTLQGAAPNTMLRAGFNPRDMRRGIEVEITWHPMRNGKPGGTLATMKLPDGRVFKDNEFGDADPASASQEASNSAQR